MSKKEQFLFEPKKWLGDAAILSMDWDVRGMHIHLMCMALQQEKKGYLEFNDLYLCKLLSVDEKDLKERILKQLLMAWKIKEEVTLFEKKQFLYLSGLNETIKKDKLDNEIKKNDKNIKELQSNNNENSENIRHTIWTIGVGLLKHQNGTELKARAYLGKLIKTYGEAAVAKSIAQLSVRNIQPAEINSYLMGLLRSEGSIAKNNKGKVAL